MKWSKAQLALSASALVVLGTAMSPNNVAQASVHTMYQKHIIVNGRAIESPFAFVYQGTTYMPLFYVQYTLRQLGISNNWNGAQTPQVWSLSTLKQDASLYLAPPSGTVNITVNGHIFVQHLTRQVDQDPYTGVETTFVPIWYIQMVLRSLGMANDWDGTNWTMTAKYNDYTASGSSLGMFVTLQDAEAGLGNNIGAVVKDASGNVVYTKGDFTNADLRFAAPSNVNAGTIDQYFASHNSPLAGLGQSFMNAQAVYGVNANYLLAHAIEESAWGTSSIAQAKNNLYGYGAYDSNPGTAAGRYPSWDYAIRFQAFEVRNNYLNPGAPYYVSPTLKGMNVNYATDPSWASNIGTLMQQFATSQNDTVQSYTIFPSNKAVPAPQSSSEPLFYTGGFTGTVKSTYYPNGGLPVYGDIWTGNAQMFTGNLQNGSSGQEVATMQSALNSKIGAGLVVDGQFGPMSQNALTRWQQSQPSLASSPAGVCDFATWSTLVPTPSTLAANSSVSIDTMEQGMQNGLVVEWYHIAGSGWVSSNYISFTNVCRLTVPNPASAAAMVKVYDPNNHANVIATMHAGDFVTYKNQSAGGYYTIYFANQANGATETGLIAASQAWLTSVN